MYELKTNRDNLLEKYSGTKKPENKRQKGIYLQNWQWKALDKLAEDKGKSRNQVLRDLLEIYFSRGKEISQQFSGTNQGPDSK